MTEFAIDVSHLRKQFGRKVVLNDVTLKIPRGQITGLLGLNGAGKSTLIKCLLGLLRPTSGSVTVLGKDAWDLEDQQKMRLGYVPQEVSLYPWMTVRQIVNYVSAFYTNWDNAWSDELLRRWELPLSDRFGPLSVGQKQKLALVLALGHRPELLILDEPVASLDPVARRWFLESILEMASDERHTVLFSTHITSDLERVASHVALMKEGVILFHDELDTLKDQVKRLRLETASDLPQSFSVQGALRTEVHGRNAIVTVPSASTALVDELQDRWSAQIAVEDLNLEEIFLEMHAQPTSHSN
ncbi:MAG: ABC transporter ATP-binding protein [Planctomycetaceae bacterium]|nr:ABC transporter ATP-binding protein [Planctomycetaceae bacterium]